MKFNFDENLDNSSVTAYDNGWIRIGSQRIDVPCVVSASGILFDVLPASLHGLNISHFGRIIELAPEIVLLGTGAKQIFVDHAITTALAERGMALETMDTGAACRSYNILLAESRSVAAALYMI
jgi:uncharacterized protein